MALAGGAGGHFESTNEQLDNSLRLVALALLLFASCCTQHWSLLYRTALVLACFFKKVK